MVVVDSIMSYEFCYKVLLCGFKYLDGSIYGLMSWIYIVGNFNILVILGDIDSIVVINRGPFIGPRLLGLFKGIG